MPNMNNIELGKGVDSLKFGMTKEEVLKLLGEPDDKELYSYDEDEESEEDDDLTEVWHYDTHEYSLSFDEADNWRLVMIAASDEKYTLEGKLIIGLDESSAIKLLNDLKLGTVETDELEDDGGRVLKVEEKSLNVWMDNGIVSELQWGPFWDENDEPIFP
jgi:hypothetical protein